MHGFKPCLSSMPLSGIPQGLTNNTGNYRADSLNVGSDPDKQGTTGNDQR